MKAAALILLLVGLAAAESNSTNYQCTCSKNCCTNIPSDGRYLLTSFCDQETACGKSCGDCKWAYCTSAMRFGCNAQLRCCLSSSPSKCTTMQVIDSGPACWVENNAGMPIIDASYSTCSYFTGSTSCGYSDGIKITCSRVKDAENVPFEMLGPCSTSPEKAANEGIPVCPGVEIEY